MNRFGPERPRRRVADGIDAGFRLALSFGLTKAWVWSVAYLYIHEQNFAWGSALLICGLPFPVAHAFAWMTLTSWLDGRSWLRAQRLARETPAVGERGMTAE